MPTEAPAAAPVEGASATPWPEDGLPVYGYQVVHVYPHDRAAFTEGLLYLDGFLYESTGLLGQSSLRRVELATGEVVQKIELDPAYFGEGLAAFGERLIQLTWQSQTGFVYDRSTFALQRTFSYPTEGWGLTTDGRRLIMSNGTDTLYFLDPQTLERVGELRVSGPAGSLTQINELEYVRGEIYANIWKTERLARIDPGTGHVLGWVDLTGLLSQEDRQQQVDVLNGIAYDPAGDRLFVTGKWWPKLFEVKLIP